MKMSRKAVVLYASLLSFFSLSAHAEETRISLAIWPGGITGSYFATGTSICQQVNQLREGQGIRCSSTKALNSTDAILALGTRYDLALVLSADAFNAHNGLDDFSQVPFDDLRSVFSLTFDNGVVLNLVTLAGLPDAVVYSLVAAIFNDFDAFRSRHPALNRQNTTAMIKSGQSAPLHPGALTYYTEKGWL